MSLSLSSHLPSSILALMPVSGEPGAPCGLPGTLRVLWQLPSLAFCSALSLPSAAIPDTKCPQSVPNFLLCSSGLCFIPDVPGCVLFCPTER